MFTHTQTHTKFTHTYRDRQENEKRKRKIYYAERQIGSQKKSFQVTRKTDRPIRENDSTEKTKPTNQPKVK